MNLLDKVQGTLRDKNPLVVRFPPEFGINEHRHIITRLQIKNQMLGASRWSHSNEGARELARYRGQCVLVFGSEIVGHGKTMGEAYEMAVLKKFIHPRWALAICVEDKPYAFFCQAN